MPDSTLVPPSLRLPRQLSGAGGIAVAVVVMNIGTYAFTMLAARLLGPGDYGAFAALMALILVIGVLQLGVQTTAARRIAAAPDQVAAVAGAVMRVSWRAGLALAALMLALAPAVDHVLRLDSVVAAALVAFVVLPMTVMGGQAGILQGERRWAPLALLFLANGLPRLLVGGLLVAWQPDTVTAMVGVALGQWAPVVIGAIALRPLRVAAADRRSAGPVLREAVANSQALLAFFALSNVDVVVARNLLSEHQAGLYAGGLILTKAVLFLPQFVVVLAFPAMSTPRERRTALLRSLTAAGALGAAATLGATLLSGLALVFVGGGEYAEIQDRLWLFGLLGTALALLQVLVYSVVARQGRRSVLVVWGAVVVLIAGGLTATSVGTLLAVVIGVDVVLVAALLALSLLRLHAPRNEPATRA